MEGGGKSREGGERSSSAVSVAGRDEGESGGGGNEAEWGKEANTESNPTTEGDRTLVPLLAAVSTRRRRREHSLREKQKETR